MQNYTNYHLVVIDDASNDSTGAKIKEFLEKNQSLVDKSRYQVIVNAQNLKAATNIRRAAK